MSSISMLCSISDIFRLSMICDCRKDAVGGHFTVRCIALYNGINCDAFKLLSLNAMHPCSNDPWCHLFRNHLLPCYFSPERKFDICMFETKIEVSYRKSSIKLPRSISFPPQVSPTSELTLTNKPPSNKPHGAPWEYLNSTKWWILHKFKSCVVLVTCLCSSWFNVRFVIYHFLCFSSWSRPLSAKMAVYHHTAALSFDKPLLFKYART